MRLVKKHTLSGINVVNSHVRASEIVADIPNMERVIAASMEEGVTVSERVQGSHAYDMEPDVIEGIPDEHIEDLIKRRILAAKRGVQFDPNPGNVLYDPKNGFTDIDFHLNTPDAEQITSKADATLQVLKSLDCITQYLVASGDEQKKIEKAGLAVRNRMLKFLEENYDQETYATIRSKWVVWLSLQKVILTTQIPMTRIKPTSAIKQR